MILIGIAGRSSSHKTSMAEFLARELNARIHSVAHPVKEACAASLGVSINEFEALSRNAVMPGINLTPRQLMQRMGDILTSGNSHFLINRLKHAIDRDYIKDWPGNSVVIVKDIRTPREAQYIYKNDGFLIHAQRDMPDESTPLHRTENDLCIREMDYVIKHSGDTTDLLKKLEMLADTIKHKLRDVA